MTAHLEEHFSPIVATYIHQNGVAYWSDIFDHIEHTVPLTAADYALYEDDSITFQRTLRNLKSNKSLVAEHAGIIQVKDGFATTEYAKAHNIQEQTATNRGNTTKQKKARKEVQRINATRAFDIYYYTQKHIDDYNGTDQIKIHMNKGNIYKLIVNGQSPAEAIFNTI